MRRGDPSTTPALLFTEIVDLTDTHDAINAYDTRRGNPGTPVGNLNP